MKAQVILQIDNANGTHDKIEITDLTKVDKAINAYSRKRLLTQL